MTNQSHPTRVEEAFINSPYLSNSNYYKTENGVSAKSWYPFDDENMKTNAWSSKEMEVMFYSTGLCKINFSIKSINSIFKWGIRLLDKSKKQLFSIEFAPLVVDSENNDKLRSFKLERRFAEIDDSLLKKCIYIQVCNLNN